ncbi:MAG: hypothetical protein KIT22_11200, partial [Verrucomicrobiae bacterium]|nr:hypothetical protein [Verrucomicrobiae bacterium]
MNAAILHDVLQALKLAVFQRDAHGRLQLAGCAPEWLAALWPQAAETGRTLPPSASPFLENFLVDAAVCW